MSFDSTIHAKATELTRLTLEMTSAAGSGHASSGASLAHIVSVLMYQHMRFEPSNPTHPCSDRLVLSEGHAVPIVYAACADLGVMIGKTKEDWRPMTREDALTLRDISSPIDGHPNPIEGFPFFDAATGSLGQGLSVSAGIAAAAREDALDRRIFCIIGDGEAREGQVWEAVDFIRDEKLKAVCPIFNANAFAQSDVVSPQQSADVLVKKLEAAGFDVQDVDGHQPTALFEALSHHAQRAHDPEAAPVALVARTVKGWGVPSLQGEGHHGQAPKEDQLQTMLEELEQTGRSLGAAADTTLKRGLISSQRPEPREAGVMPTLEQACREAGAEDKFAKGAMSTRRAYGVALRALGHSNPNVFALDGDVKNSTYAQDFFKDESLHPRFLECRIAEQNMVSVAAGLNAGRKIPFVSTFAKFLTRAYDQVEMAVNSGLNFKLIGSHAGISLGADGPSQMGMPDVGWFRGFSTTRNKDGYPAFFVLQPADAYATYGLVQLMADSQGPCYMRVHRPDVEFVYGPDHQFQLGDHEVLTEGRDLLIIASGYMVHQANKAIDKLDEAGVSATLVDLYSLPFDEESILDLANENNGMILTLEDNYGGGFGSAIADAVSADGGGFTVQQMHVKYLPKSGKTADELMTYCRLSVDDVVKEAMGMLQLTEA